MSIYKCFLFLLMACMVVNGQADTSLKRIIINAGDDYTFICLFPNNLENVSWYRTSYVDHQYSNFISLLQPTRGVSIHYYPDFVAQRMMCQHNVSTSPGYDIFSLTVFNMTTADSAMYSCLSEDFTQRYDTQVVGCPCIVTTEPLLDHGTALNGKNVTCPLATYPRANFVFAQTIIRRGNKNITGSILGNKIRFSLNDALRKNLTVTVNPFRHFEGNISCVVPAQLTPTLTTQVITTVVSATIATPIEKLTSPPSIASTLKTPAMSSSIITPTEKIISPSSFETTTSMNLLSTRIFTPNEKITSPSSFESTTTTQLVSTSITTPTENPNTEPSTNHLSTRGENTTSSQVPVIVSTSLQAENPLQNLSKETDKQKSDSGGAIVIVISALGSSVILMFVIVIVVLRFRRKRERAPTRSTPIRQETAEEQAEVEETDMCYASIQDTAPPEHASMIPGTEKGGDGKLDCSSLSSDGMVDNHLYDFNMDGSRTERTTELSPVDADLPLYTMPDRANKSGSGSYRDLCEAQKEIVHPSRHPSLSSRGRSDDVTPPQESQEGAKHHGGGRDGTGDVMLDLYAVPNKCPGPRKVAAHYNPGKPDDNHDKGHDVSALYAVVDRSSEVAKEEPRDVTDLYAVVDKRNNNK